MKITNIEPQKNCKRVNIYIDNKFAFGITDELRYKYKLHVDNDIDQDYIDSVLKAEEQQKVTNHALNLLSYRQRSEKELYRALSKKGYEDDYISHTFDFLREYNLLDDIAFSNSFIIDKQNLNKFGSIRIKYELMNKGISKDVIEKTLDIDPELEYETAMDLATKKLRTYTKEDKNATYRKIAGFLQRKGYSFDIISKILRELLED